METEITDIGKVAITPRKDYKNEQAYEWLDVVTYDGSSYMCIAEDGCTGIVPTNTDCWQLLADKGHFTEEDKEEFKKAVVEESKAEINEHTDNKKTELNNYTTELEKSLENELDTYKTEKETQMDSHKAALETEMANKKDSLIEEIETAQNGFDTNAEEKTNTFNSNVETKTTEFNNNSNAKTEEFNNNSTEKINAFNSNAEEKIADYDEHVETLTSRIADLEEENSELAQQMSWNTTEIQESIYVADSARYSKNKLSLFGNMAQETREGYNLLDISNIQTQEKYGVTITNNGDGTLTFNGTSTNNFGINTEIKPKTLLAGNYTKSIPRDTNIKTGLTISLGTVSGGAIPKTTLQPGTGTATFELEEDSTYNQLRMYIGSGTIFNNYVLKWMIVKGTYTSETIPPFEQYGAMPSIEYPSMPVVATGLQKIKKIGKNFIPYPYAENSKSTYGIQYTVNKDGSIAVSGTSKNPACDFYLYGSSTDTGEYLYMKKGTYSIADTNIYNILYIAREKTLGALVGVAKIKQALASQDCYFYGYFLRVEKDITVNATFYPQLELNDTETFYEPYSGEEITLDLGTTELCKITDQNGNVVAQDGAVYRQVNNIFKWQWEKNVYKDFITNLDNNFPLEITSYVADNLYGVAFSSSEKHKVVGQVIAIISDKLKAKFLGSITDKTNTNSVRNAEGIALHSNNNNQVCITLEKTRLETKNLNGVNNFIKKNNIILYYPILEPIYLDCTEEQSAVLDKLYKLSLEKGTNNIFVESENGVTTELQLEYMQDNNLKKEQENKALEDRITAIENLLSTTETSALLLDNMQSDLESEVE